MDVSIGNRLYQYRRKSGLSQEELAAKLGVSRQAVSKWERAEAAPDTDNLINLSKIYGVTLDELINTDPADSAARSSDSSDDEINTDDNSEKKNKVHIGFDGIHVDDGKDKVDISWPAASMEMTATPRFMSTRTMFISSKTAKWSKMKSQKNLWFQGFRSRSSQCSYILCWDFSSICGIRDGSYS